MRTQICISLLNLDTRPLCHFTKQVHSTYLPGVLTRVASSSYLSRQQHRSSMTLTLSQLSLNSKTDNQDAHQCMTPHNSRFSQKISIQADQSTEKTERTLQAHHAALLWTVKCIRAHIWYTHQIPVFNIQTGSYGWLYCGYTRYIFQIFR